MKIAICDDNIYDIKIVHDICSKHDPDASINKFVTGNLLYQEIKKGYKPNIIIIDVDMPGDNGIEIGKKIREIDTKTIIIFYTSYPQYAVESYDCEAFYYLLKPCSEEKLLNTLERAYEKDRLRDQRISVKYHGVPRSIAADDIYYIECIRRHIVYHMKNEDIEVIGKISDAFEEVKDLGFCQIHQGYIVNMKKIINFENLMVCLLDGKQVPMSTRKKREVMVQYAKFTERNL